MNPAVKLGGFVILIAVIVLVAYATGASLGPVAVRYTHHGPRGPMYMGGAGPMNAAMVVRPGGAAGVGR